jgi:hypothetical protein
MLFLPESSDYNDLATNPTQTSNWELNQPGDNIRFGSHTSSVTPTTSGGNADSSFTSVPVQSNTISLTNQEPATPQKKEFSYDDEFADFITWLYSGEVEIV